MSRASLTLSNDAIREKAIHWIKTAPNGTRVDFKEAKRTLPQNDRMWAMLTDIASQATLGGAKYSTDEWKCIFMDALGQEMKFLPKLEGTGFVPVGHRSSDLTVKEMGDLMELMTAWALQHGVVFSEPEWRAA